MSQRNRLSILSKASSSSLRLAPYPHLVIDNALDPEVFAALDAAFPDDATIVDGRQIADTWFDYPACKVIRDATIAPLWREFFRYHTSARFFGELVDLFGDDIRALNPGLEARIGRPLQNFRAGMRPGGKEHVLAVGADVSMECQFYVNYSTCSRTVRGPHVDRPSELFGALLYFRQPDDTAEGGDLDICEAMEDIYPNEHAVRIARLPAEISPASVSTVSRAKYRANTLVLFLNSARSVHAVSPRTPTSLTRRHINFCCDVPFDLFKLQMPPKLALKKQLTATPFVWRLARHIAA